MTATDPDPLLATPARRSRRLLPLLLLLAAAGGGLLLLRGGGGEAAVRYRTEAVSEGPFTVTVTATGTLQPVNQVEVGSELSGTVRTVAADFNDRVAAGRTLAELDKATLEGKVVQSRAAAAAAAAKVTETEATLLESRLSRDRCARLAGKQMCSREQLDGAEAAFKRAEAQLASARAQVEVARATLAVDETNLRKATIRAPIDGVVLDRRVEPGQTVAAQLQTPVLFVLAEDLKRMELHVDVDEADIGQVREGQGATFSVDAYPDRSFPATIAEVRFAPQTVEGVVTYRAVLTVDNGELLLRPGMTATAEITVRRVESARLVPTAALRFEPPAARGQGQGKGGGNRGALSWLFRPPSSATNPAPPPAPAPHGAGKRVWLLEGGRPVARTVTAGASDGRLSELPAAELAAGTEVIVGLEERRP